MRPRRLLLIGLLAFTGLTACDDDGGDGIAGSDGSGDRGFCDAARGQDIDPDEFENVDPSEALEEAQAAAPDELKDDYEVVREFLDGDVDPTDREAFQEYTDAVRNITGFVAEKCGPGTSIPET